MAKGNRGGNNNNDIGQFGEGMEEQNTTTRVLRSHPLTREIDQGGGQFADEIMRTRDALEAEYGSAVKQMNLHAATFSDNTTLGAYGEDTLYMNEKYIRNKYLTQAMKDTGGFHPGIGDKTGAEAVAAHEIGHRLGEIAAQRGKVSQKDIVARAGQKIGVKTENVAGHISGYARSNYGETIAEACADAYCNGSKASNASQAIMAEIKAILK
jgi:hypothetical protein